jgi:hypothetical protein
VADAWDVLHPHRLELAGMAQEVRRQHRIGGAVYEEDRGPDPRAGVAAAHQGEELAQLERAVHHHSGVGAGRLPELGEVVVAVLLGPGVRMGADPAHEEA